MRKLALDIGTKTCGFAITDESEIIASNLETLRYQEDQALEKIIEYIKNLEAKYKIDGLIIGYPIKLDGSKSPTTLFVEKVVAALKQNLNLPYLLINEQYSTKKAHQIMINAGLTRQKRKLHKDKMAAQLILEDYLEYYQNKWGK